MKQIDKLDYLQAMANVCLDLLLDAEMKDLTSLPGRHNI